MPLNLDEHVKTYQAMDDWFKMPQGVRAAQAFSEELAVFQLQLRG